MSGAYLVFVSHASADLWVARQIAKEIQLCGAETFLDDGDIDHGDDFESRILAAGRTARELLVLLTPWSLKRPYIWLEIGLFWGDEKRVVGVLHGVTKADLATDQQLPVMLKRVHMLEINAIDSYFDQLRQRVSER